MAMYLFRAEKILHESGVSVAPPPQTRSSAISFLPSQAIKDQSSRVRQDSNDNKSDEESSQSGNSEDEVEGDHDDGNLVCNVPWHLNYSE